MMGCCYQGNNPQDAAPDSFSNRMAQRREMVLLGKVLVTAVFLLNVPAGRGLRGSFSSLGSCEIRVEAMETVQAAPNDPYRLSLVPLAKPLDDAFHRSDKLAGISSYANGT